jgi:hypothetical protein
MFSFARFILTAYAPMRARHALLDGQRVRAGSADDAQATPAGRTVEANACADTLRLHDTPRQPARARADATSPAA